MLGKKKQKNTPQALITSPTSFPSGLAIKTESGTYWIKDNKKFKLISENATESWSFSLIMASDTALSNIKTVGKLGFRDGTLIKNIADGKMYLISQNKKRHIVNADVFAKYGLDRSKLIEVSSYEVDMHEDGENL